MAEEKKFDSFEPQVVEVPSVHERPENLDPKVNGPFLDEIRAAQEEHYREHRNAAEKENG